MRIQLQETEQSTEVPTEHKYLTKGRKKFPSFVGGDSVMAGKEVIKPSTPEKKVGGSESPLKSFRMKRNKSSTKLKSDSNPLSKQRSVTTSLSSSSMKNYSNSTSSTPNSPENMSPRSPRSSQSLQSASEPSFSNETHPPSPVHSDTKQISLPSSDDSDADADSNEMEPGDRLGDSEPMSSATGEGNEKKAASVQLSKSDKSPLGEKKKLNKTWSNFHFGNKRKTSSARSSIMETKGTQSQCEHEGFLKKRGQLNPAWKKRYFKIISNSLFYFKSDKAVSFPFFFILYFFPPPYSTQFNVELIESCIEGTTTGGSIIDECKVCGAKSRSA